MRRRRVVVVGAGRRARETILPALHCLRERTALEGVVARSVRDVSLLGGRIEFTTADDIGSFDVSSLDAVLVAVPVREVPSVLAALTRFDTGHLTLMLDTPVLHHRDLGAARHFSRFRYVLASEDAIALPPYQLARRVIGEGAVGRPRYVYMMHTGYRYHALSTLQALTGARHPTRISVRRWNPSSAEIRFRFPGAVRAMILEPLGDGNGRFMIAGDRGVIVDYPLRRRNTTEIGYRFNDRRYVGLSLDGEPVPDTELDRAFLDGTADVDLPDPSLHASLKVRAFMDLLVGALDGASPYRYPARNAIHDSLCIRVAERLGFFKDVRLGGATLFGGMITLASGLAPGRGR